MIHVSRRVPARPVLRIALRALLVAWAGFWAWFALAVSFGGSEAPPPNKSVVKGPVTQELPPRAT